jgi:hypothetical protein
MVLGAEQHEVGGVGLSAVTPPDDVVGMKSLGRSAARELTVLISGLECSEQRWTYRPLVSAEIELCSVGIVRNVTNPGVTNDARQR